MKSSVLYFFLTIGMLLNVSTPARAKMPSWASESDDCSAGHFHVNDLVSYAELKEQRLTAASIESINPGANGSIRVHGWNQAGVLVKACVQSAAPSDSEARAIASQVSVAQGAGQIQPNGPSTDDQHYWN